MHNSKGGSPKILNYDCTNYFLYHQNAFEISPFFCSFWWKFWLFDPNPWIRLFFWDPDPRIQNLTDLDLKQSPMKLLALVFAEILSKICLSTNNFLERIFKTPLPLS